MSGKYATPLLLEPAPSAGLRAWLLLVHCLAIAILPCSTLPWWLALVIASVLMYSLRRSLSVHASRSHPDAICEVALFDTDSCRLRLASGVEIKARLLPQCFILPWLVILYFRCEDHHRRHLVLLPDMLDDELFRQLRVRLMIRREPVAA